jgi:hypothetical protein
VKAFQTPSAATAVPTPIVGASPRVPTTRNGQAACDAHSGSAVAGPIPPRRPTLIRRPKSERRRGTPTLQEMSR